MNTFESAARPREASTRIVREVVRGSRVRADARVLQALPDLLGLAHLGVVLFWVYDSSPDRRRSRLQVTTASPVLEGLVGLTR